MKDTHPGTIKRVVIISDGSGKEYKSGNSFARTKALARKYGISILWHFYCTDDGKGLVDSLGHRFHVDYREGIPDMKTNARLVDKVAEWMNSERNKFK